MYPEIRNPNFDAFLSGHNQPTGICLFTIFLDHIRVVSFSLNIHKFPSFRKKMLW